MSELKSAYDRAIAQLTAPGAPYAISSRELNGVVYKMYDTAPANITEVYAQAAQHGNSEFLVYEEERISFRQLLQQAAAIGHQLVHKLGIGKGDRVAIAMRNYPEWMSSYVAITSCGAVAVPLNSWGQARELAYTIEDADAKLVFCDQQRHALLADFLQSQGAGAVVVRADNSVSGSGAIDFRELLAGQEHAVMPVVEIDSEDLVMILYTSGTTGMPKGAVSTHRALCQSITNFEVAATASAMSNPQAISRMMESGLPPTQLLAVPLFHVSGLHAAFLLAFKGGRKLVMMYRWDAEQALRLVESERITVVSAAPAMLLQLLESEDFDRRDTSSLFSVGAGGAATPPRTSRLIYEKLPESYSGTGWGMTETNAIGTSFTGNPHKHKLGSAGFQHPTVEIEVRAPEGGVLPQGEPGELWIKSATLISEYWNRPDATAKDFRDGWFNSGDIGYFDEESYLFISDRAKDMVIRGGENIYPAEIEGVLHDCPKIEEAAAFGIADEQWGEQLAVVVVARAGAQLSAEDVREFAARKLARFKVPHYVFLHGQPLPRSASGKVLKKDLKAEYEKLAGQDFARDQDQA